jgi:hypothetical protein
MSKNCKEFLLVIVVTVLLVAVFSYLDLPVKEIKKPSAMKFKGDSGAVIPGNGKATESPTQEKTEIVTEEAEEEAEEVTEVTEETKITSQEFHTVIKEEHKKMDGMVIAFWHGVAAVLIGGAGTLLVAYVWSKIKKGSEPK